MASPERSTASAGTGAPRRRSCQQIQRFYDAANARWLAGEQALANIDPGRLSD
jgi:hypothetical protein